MAQVLNAAGIRTLHDETLYDAPGYTDSYKRSRAGVQAYLERYPSIKVVLDVHRDAIEDSDGTRVKPAARSTARARRRSWSLPGAATAAALPCLTGGSTAFCRRMGGHYGQCVPGRPAPCCAGIGFTIKI